MNKTETNQNKIKKLFPINEYIVKKLNNEKSKRLDKLKKQSKKYSLVYKIFVKFY